MHVLCELHLKKNCKAKLKQSGTIGHVLYQIFGGELQVTNFGDRKDATRIGREKTEYKENWSCRFAEVVATFAVAAQVQPGSTDVPTEEQFARLLDEQPKVFSQRWHNNEPRI